MAEEGLVVCTGCGEIKQTDCFSLRGEDKTKYRSQCKECVAASNLVRYHSNKSTKLAHHRSHRKNMLKKYGLTPEDYETLLTSQGGVCKICGQKESRSMIKNLDIENYLVVDHCHVSGSVRGLLCHGCNVGLGAFKDSPELLQKAIRYLKESK